MRFLRFISLLCAVVLAFCALGGCADGGNNNLVETDGKHIITATNPIMWSDVPDEDVIRVGDTYYMVSTTMYFTPGVPIMKSKDLVTWELIGYVYDILENSPQTDLVGDNHAYSKGSWAASIRYYNNMFYVLFCAWDQGKTYIYKTADIENPSWERVVFDRVFHDATLFFEDDGTPYIISGAGDVWITELEKDLSAIKSGGVDKKLFNTGIVDGLSGAEGAHAYKIDGKYYITMISYATSTPGIRRCELCFRSDNLMGEYEGKVVLCDDMGYYGNGTAQGGIVDTPEGNWYALLFQDHGAVGRIPILQPVTWVDGWPMMGEDSKSAKVVSVLSELTEWKESTLMANDEFDYTENKLKLNWQFNHNPDNENWSVTDRNGWYRITTSRVDKDMFHAKNSLTQRTEGPFCTSEVLIDASGLNPGDYAGIAAFQTNAGFIGVYSDDSGAKHIYFAKQNRNEEMNIIREEPLSQDNVYLKIEYNFSTVNEDGSITTEDKAKFYYSLDGENWEKLSKGFTMTYDLDFFTGYRTALYCYSTKEAGGHADFDYYHVTKSGAEID